MSTKTYKRAAYCARSQRESPTGRSSFQWLTKIKNKKQCGWLVFYKELAFATKLMCHHTLTAKFVDNGSRGGIGGLTFITRSLVYGIGLHKWHIAQTNYIFMGCLFHFVLEVLWHSIRPNISVKIWCEFLFALPYPAWNIACPDIACPATGNICKQCGW